jgi:hypothetical protein
MKKLLYLIVSVFMLSCPAWGENQECFKWIDNDIKTHFLVLFETSKATVSEACKSEIKEELQERFVGVDMNKVSISIKGKASKSGGVTENNMSNAEGRRDFAKVLVTELGYESYIRDTDATIDSDDTKSDNDNDQDSRSALIVFAGITTLVDGGGNGDGGTVADNENITNVYNQLMALGIFSEKRDVWIDKEGTFNEARLLSDSLAGVALGTAGGLISSHVIKKSQVKKGFEDIQCVIADKPVANWGDTFGVGIQ